MLLLSALNEDELNILGTIEDDEMVVVLLMLIVEVFVFFFGSSRLITLELDDSLGRLIKDDDSFVSLVSAPTSAEPSPNVGAFDGSRPSPFVDKASVLLDVELTGA